MSKPKTAKEIIKQRAEQRTKEGIYNVNSSNKILALPSEVSLFKPEPETEYELSIITYIVKYGKHPDGAPAGMAFPRRPFWRHSGIGGSNASFVCRKSVGKKCFLCEERSRLFDDDADKKLTDNLRPSYRELYIMLSPDGEFEVMEMAYSNFGEILDRKLNRLNDDRCGYFQHKAEDGGHTLIAYFMEDTYQRAKFPKLDEVDFEPREDLDIEPEDVPCLDNMFIISENVEMKAAYYDMEVEELEQMTEDDGENEDESEGEQPRKPVRRGTRRKKDENDENDSDKRKSSRSRGSSRRRRKKEDDDNETELNDETEETDEEGDDSEQLGKSCPHGHKFGKDAGKYDECEDCDMWDECSEESEPDSDSNGENDENPKRGSRSGRSRTKKDDDSSEKSSRRSSRGRSRARRKK